MKDTSTQFQQASQACNAVGDWAEICQQFLFQTSFSVGVLVRRTGRTSSAIFVIPLDSQFMEVLTRQHKRPRHRSDDLMHPSAGKQTPAHNTFCRKAPAQNYHVTPMFTLRLNF